MIIAAIIWILCYALHRFTLNRSFDEGWEKGRRYVTEQYCSIHGPVYAVQRCPKCELDKLPSG